MRCNEITLLFYILFLLVSGRSLAQGEESALQCFLKAESMRKSKKYIEAIFEYDKAIKAEPGNFRFVFSKGTCYYMIKDADSAISAFLRTVQIKNDYIPAYTMLAQCYKVQKRYSDVVTSLESAYKYDSDTQKKLKYKITIISILVRNKEYARAQPHIVQAKAMSPTDPEILYYEAKVANELGDFTTAKALLVTVTNRLTAKDPKTTAKYFYELGYAYYKLGEFEDAAEVWKNANFGYFKNLIAKYNPANYFATALSYFKIYDYTHSREYIDVTLKMQHNFTQAHVLLGEVAKKENAHVGGLEHYQKAVLHETDAEKKAEMYKMMAMQMMEASNFAETIRLSTESLKLKPADYNLIFVQAMAYYRMKNFGQSAKILEELTAIAGLDVESKAQYTFALAVVYRAANMLEKSKAMFRKTDYGTYAKAAQMEYNKMTQKEEKEEVPADDVNLDIE